MESLRIYIFCLLSVISAPAQAALCADHLLAMLQTPDDRQEGLVTAEVPLSFEALLAAYGLGLYPIPHNGPVGIGFIDPPLRGTLILAGAKPRRTDRKIIQKWLASGEYSVTFDRKFEEVIRGCAEMQHGNDNWIAELGEPFIQLYIELHRRGLAHSVEVMHGRELVAGLYGVHINGVFSGESMFHKESNAMKLGFDTLVRRLRAGGHVFIDTQENLNLVRSFGGVNLPRERAHVLRQAAHKLNLPFPTEP